MSHLARERHACHIYGLLLEVDPIHFHLAQLWALSTSCGSSVNCWEHSCGSLVGCWVHSFAAGIGQAVYQCPVQKPHSTLCARETYALFS